MSRHGAVLMYRIAHNRKLLCYRWCRVVEKLIKFGSLLVVVVGAPGTGTEKTAARKPLAAEQSDKSDALIQSLLMAGAHIIPPPGMLKIANIIWEELCTILDSGVRPLRGD